MCPLLPSPGDAHVNMYFWAFIHSSAIKLTKDKCCYSKRSFSWNLKHFSNKKVDMTSKLRRNSHFKTIHNHTRDLCVTMETVWKYFQIVAKSLNQHDTQLKTRNLGKVQKRKEKEKKRIMEIFKFTVCRQHKNV